MENPEQAFVEYASSRTDEAGGKWYAFKPEQNNLGDTYNPSWKSHPNLKRRQPQNSLNNFSNPPNCFQPNGLFPNRPFNIPQNFNNQSNLEGLVSSFMASQDTRLSKFEANFKQQQGEMTNKIDTFLKAINDRMKGALPKNDRDVMFVELIKKFDDSSEEELEVNKNAVTEKKLGVECFDKFLTRSKLAYHKYLMCASIPSLFLRNPIIVGGSPSNLKIPCNIGHVHVEKAYIDLNSPINIMTCMQYNWIMRKQLEPREDPESIIGINFMIVEDISLIMDLRLSQVVLGKPFVEVSNMTRDLLIGVVKFTIGDDEIAYMMPLQDRAI
ncbi:hypothetical protein Tco_0575266 [Tanacetum coccineum]